MKYIILCTVSLIVFAAGCGPTDDGFRFGGEYFADRSGLSVQILSEGIAPAESGEGGGAFMIVQVCPGGATEGRPLRMTFTLRGDRSTYIDSRELGPVAMLWTKEKSEGLLRGLLTTAGFRKIDAGELAGLLAAIERGLDPKGKAGAKGTDGVLRVVKENFSDGQDIDHNADPAEWITQEEVVGCK